MASYDQLSAQQRAIVDLVLKRGQSYDKLADTLEMPVERVRELARESLVSLAPVSAAAVDGDWRDRVADYLLGQQQPPAAADTRAHLRRSEAARAWSRSVLDALDDVYPDGDMPTIPSAGASAPDPPAPAAKATAGGVAPPDPAAVVRRRRLIGAGAIALVVLLALLLWPIGLLTGAGGGGDDGGAQAGEGDLEVVGQVVLRPVGAADRDQHAGIAIVTDDGGTLEMSIQARLAPTRRNQAYEVWLTAPERDPVSLGAQVTDRQGNFAGRAALPDDYREYELIEVTREPVDDDRSKSGDVFLRARVDRIGAAQGSAGN